MYLFYFHHKYSLSNVCTKPIRIFFMRNRFIRSEYAYRIFGAWGKGTKVNRHEGQKRRH